MGQNVKSPIGTKATNWAKENEAAINEYNERIAKYGTFGQSIEKHYVVSLNTAYDAGNAKHTKR